MRREMTDLSAAMSIITSRSLLFCLAVPLSLTLLKRGCNHRSLVCKCQGIGSYRNFCSIRTSIKISGSYSVVLVFV